MSGQLFPQDPTPRRLALGPQACVLGGFALPHLADVMPALRAVLDAAPLRHLVTPGGFTMSVAMSNCGRSEEHTSELQSLMRISYAVFCLKKKKKRTHRPILNCKLH